MLLRFLKPLGTKNNERRNFATRLGELAVEVVVEVVVGVVNYLVKVLAFTIGYWWG
jgi:hypothetical protein